MDQRRPEVTAGPLNVFGDPSAVVDDQGTNDWGTDKIAESDLVLAMYIIICVVGITGNLLVCVVLLRVPSLRSTTSDFLVHLSLVDLAVCLTVIPYKIVPSLGQPSAPLHSPLWDQIRCKLYVSQFPFWICAYCSIFSLLSVNLERFVAIVYPLRYKSVFGGKRNKRLVIAFCWTWAILMSTYMLIFYVEDEHNGCIFLGFPSPTVQKIIGLYTYVFTLSGPFILMVSVQWKVISTLKQQVKTLTGQAGSSEMNQEDRRKMWQLRAAQTLVRTLVVCALTYAVCWGPLQHMYTLFCLGVELDFTSPIYHFGVILAIGNSCVNPIIYTLTNRPFRRGITEAFGCRKKGRVGQGTDGASTVSGRVNTAATKTETV